MLETLFVVHSHMRYLVLLAAVVALVAAAAGMRRTTGNRGPERGTMAAFVGVVDIQVLLGLVLLALFPFYPALIGHIVMMVVAAVTAHVGSIMARRRADHAAAARLRVITIGLTLVFIVGGIMAIQRPIL
jgi:hypothetical protein